MKQYNNETMKVCLISSLFPPYSRGGAEKIAELTAKGLKEEGHKIFVITTKPWNGLNSILPQSSLNQEGIKIYYFYPLNLFSFFNINKHSFFARLIWRFFDVFNFHSFLVLWFILKKEMPDIVWTHNLTGIGLLTPLLLKILKIPHIHTLHDVSLIEPSGIIEYIPIKISIYKWYKNHFIKRLKLWKNFLIRLIFGSITRKLFNSPTLVISPSKWLMNFYLHHKFFQKSKILVKQNPLDKLKITNQYKYPTEELNILYIGQLEKQKGILFLISVLNDLSLKYKFKLFIVGTGGLFNHLKEISQNKPWIVFCGRLDNEDLKNIWQKANLTIVPSLLYENSPTVIYESLVNGVPVVASRIGGIPELVEDNKNGFLFEPKDKENLKEKLIKIFENPQILSNLKSEALKFEPKSPKIYVREILEFLGNFMEFRFLK